MRHSCVQDVERTARGWSRLDTPAGRFRSSMNADVSGWRRILYLTELVGLTVHDTRGRRIGRVKDAALVPLIDPSRVDRFLVGGGWAWLTVRHDQVQSISLEGIHLRDEILTPYHSDEYMLRMVRDLLDQQIIDAQGRKVVRVNDVTFEIRPIERAITSCGCSRSTSACAAFSGACFRACCRARGSAGCSGPFRRIRSAGNSATSSSRIRSGGCG